MQEKEIDLEDDFFCFVCGKNNTSGLKLKFELSADIMKTEFLPQKIHQGFRDIVHGGIIATVLDEIMLNLLYRKGIQALTAELRVRFKKPCKVGEKLIFESNIANSSGRIIETHAQAKNEKGDIVADAEAKCFVVKNNQERR